MMLKQSEINNFINLIKKVKRSKKKLESVRRSKDPSPINNPTWNRVSTQPSQINADFMSKSRLARNRFKNRSLPKKNFDMLTIKDLHIENLTTSRNKKPTFYDHYRAHLQRKNACSNPKQDPIQDLSKPAFQKTHKLTEIFDFSTELFSDKYEHQLQLRKSIVSNNQSPTFRINQAKSRHDQNMSQNDSVNICKNGPEIMELRAEEEIKNRKRRSLAKSRPLNIIQSEFAKDRGSFAHCRSFKKVSLMTKATQLDKLEYPVKKVQKHKQKSEALVSQPIGVQPIGTPVCSQPMGTQAMVTRPVITRPVITNSMATQAIKPQQLDVSGRGDLLQGWKLMEGGRYLSEDDSNFVS